MCYQVVRTLIPVRLYDLQLRSCWFEQFDHCPVSLFAEPQWNDAALYNLSNALNIFDNSPKPSRRTSPKGYSGNQQLRVRKKYFNSTNHSCQSAQSNQNQTEGSTLGLITRLTLQNRLQSSETHSCRRTDPRPSSLQSPASRLALEPDYLEHFSNPNPSISNPLPSRIKKASRKHH